MQRCEASAAWLLLLMLQNTIYAQCPTSSQVPDCDAELNVGLFPDSFMIFGADEGQIFTAGNVVIIVAIFPDDTCRLPDPFDLGPMCTPTMMISLFTKGGTCFNLTAVSASKLERDFGFSFADEPALETDSGHFNHWVFPLHVLDGMSTSRLEIKSISIPEACNSPIASFDNTRQLRHTRLLPNIKIDATPPQIISVHTGKSPGSYTNGTILNIVVEFSKDVSISSLPDQYSQMYVDLTTPSRIPYGVPYIELNSNAIIPLRGFDTMRSKRKLSFLYKVGTGEETPLGKQLDVRAGTSIELNGGSIVGEGTGLDVNLSSIPLPGEEGACCYVTLFRSAHKRSKRMLLCRVAVPPHRKQNLHHQARRKISAAQVRCRSAAGYVGRHRLAPRREHTTEQKTTQSDKGADSVIISERAIVTQYDFILSFFWVFAVRMM